MIHGTFYSVHDYNCIMFIIHTGKHLKENQDDLSRLDPFGVAKKIVSICCMYKSSMIS